MRTRAGETRRRIVDAAYQLFYQGGFARVGVDAIATAAGITKRTLYQHFESKDALIAAVLDIQHELMLARIRQWADTTSGDRGDVVDALFAGLQQWASKRDWRGSGFTRAAIEFTDSPGHPARKAARRHKTAVEAVLAEALTESGDGDGAALARQLMLLIEGCQVLVLIHGQREYIAAAADAARGLVQSRLARSALREALATLREEPGSAAPPRRQPSAAR
ncbi:MAG: TetR/AcrR family transcriptional regulator [Rhodocyclaceae bacterium]|nr:TetR/AcrR family transcriptional regulator [Rhodocyclaceae bacterium]